MNVLIDTNIIIPLEDTSKILDVSLAQMCREARDLGYKLCIHPAQAEDIERDKDQTRREIVLSRLEQYPLIPNPPVISSQELSDYEWSQVSDNDRIDNLLLHALCRGAVHFLITNDKGIHRKARQAKCQEQVHTLDQFLIYLELQASDESLTPYGIEDRYLHEFNVKQPFFDSLRQGYTGFDDWYLKSAKSQRKAWCISIQNEIKAMCIYKLEKSPCIIDGGEHLDRDALKLCTFKIGRDVRGRKLGERFLYTAFKYAAENKIRYVYLHTHGSEHELLVSLCEDFGFKFAGTYQKKDDVYIKDMFVPSNKVRKDFLQYAIDFYPNYFDGNEVNKYIVPIRPEYHNALFADVSDTARGLFANDASMYDSQSNTIKKAYICHSNTKKINPGSLVLFYRTRDRKSIECIGVVEHTYRGKDIDKVMPLVSKRTVYSKEQIVSFLEEKDTLVILFRLMATFPPIDLNEIHLAGLHGAFQSIRKITHGQYVSLFQNIEVK